MNQHCNIALLYCGDNPGNNIEHLLLLLLLLHVMFNTVVCRMWPMQSGKVVCYKEVQQINEVVFPVFVEVILLCSANMH